MQLIIVTIFYVLIHLPTYAADTPDTKVSYATEKAEEVVQDTNVLTFTFGDGRTHNLTLDDKESFLVESYKEIILEKEKLGLPEIFLSITDNNNPKTFSYFYDGISIINWFFLAKQMLLTNPNSPEVALTDENIEKLILTNPNSAERIDNNHDLSIFSVRKRSKTDKPQYKATFIDNFRKKDLTDEARLKKISCLTSIYKKYVDKCEITPKEETQINPILRRTQFYTEVAKKYNTESCHDLAFKFAQYALEGIPDSLKKDNPEHIQLIGKRRDCLHMLGDICKIRNDIPLAIEYYNKAFNAGSKTAHKPLLNSYLNLKDWPNVIRLLEQSLISHPNSPSLKGAYKHLGNLYERIGNTDAAHAARQKFKELDEKDTEDKKRELDNTSSIEPSNKRRRETSPE